MSNLFKQKSIDCGFVIICQNDNIGQINTTINSIRSNYADNKFCCVFLEHHYSALEKRFKDLTVFKSEGSIMSSINAGLEQSLCDGWNFLIMSGTWVRNSLDRKYSCFLENEKDILFPVIKRKMNFVDGSINGVLIHKKSFKDIGKFNSKSSIDICKLYWANEAIEKGYRFKGIVGITLT